MRARVVATVALMVLPAILPAQRGRSRRVPPPTTSRPPGPAELPPMLPGITPLRYRPSRLSVEGYPLYSFVQADHYVTDTLPMNWSMQGVGTRIDFRMRPSFSFTGDATAAVGGPFTLYTGDVGARYRPQWNGRSRPYVDGRVSLAHTSDGYAQLYTPTGFAPPPGFMMSGRTTSTGLGALVGAGFETAVTEQWGLNMGLSTARHRMGAIRVGGVAAGSRWDYTATITRLTFGVRYNPHRLVRE